jgi:hypothetical protein
MRIQSIRLYLNFDDDNVAIDIGSALGKPTMFVFSLLNHFLDMVDFVKNVAESSYFLLSLVYRNISFGLSHLNFEFGGVY